MIFNLNTIYITEPVNVAKYMNIDENKFKSMFAGDKIKILREAYRRKSNEERNEYE